MEVYIPSFRYEESELERGYTVDSGKERSTKKNEGKVCHATLEVFKIEVLMSGRKHFVEKRYSEFHALHKKLKKCIRTPEIPSKHVRNWVPKVLEQRRQGLELYLQVIALFSPLWEESLAGLLMKQSLKNQGEFYSYFFCQAFPTKPFGIPFRQSRVVNGGCCVSGPTSHTMTGVNGACLQQQRCAGCSVALGSLVTRLSKLVCTVLCLLLPSTDISVLHLSSKLSHQPVLLFLRDPYVLPKANGNQTCHLLTALYDLPCTAPAALLLIQAKLNDTGLKPNSLPIRQ
ncbi:hypothetical protein ASZ78_014025 [Callipepla squamata]|uniref:PX domain-containing protein n=1 Tax=Callipepla squamata TaxID=9009 RepID=A0A226N4C4_CALSU|nr:hypothetical protein ASZ78_014025 [Callipepla squamata]